MIHNEFFRRCVIHLSRKTVGTIKTWKSRIKKKSEFRDALCDVYSTVIQEDYVSMGSQKYSARQSQCAGNEKRAWNISKPRSNHLFHYTS